MMLLHLLSELNIDEQVALVEMMEPDDAVDIIQELEDEDRRITCSIRRVQKF